LAGALFFAGAFLAGALFFAGAFLAGALFLVGIFAPLIDSLPVLLPGGACEC